MHFNIVAYMGRELCFLVIFEDGGLLVCVVESGFEVIELFGELAKRVAVHVDRIREIPNMYLYSFSK